MFSLKTTFLLTATFAVSFSAPPTSWVEHWFEHNQNVSRVFSDADVAVYFDSDVDRNINWPFQYIGDVWRYTKRVYGDFGEENNLYAIFHAAKYSGGHPSTYFDDSHDFRNVIDVGSSSSTAWTSGQGNDLDIVTHEVAHVVEGACKGVHNSPAFPIWGDSKWAEIFNYDVYMGLEMTSDASRWYDLMTASSDGFPRPNTFWFRDWFHPIYKSYGGSQVLNNFFVTLSGNFPQRGNAYTRDMNMGEFVHFWSGAAGINLQSLAENAFGWTDQWNSELNRAREEFPGVHYQ
jgi:hypothetical protein